MKDKQIEEMAKVLCKDCAKDPLPCELTKAGMMCDSVIEQAEALYNAGYRKSSDVAEKIFTEIEAIIRRHDEHPKYQLMLDLDELKKKYTEGVNENTK